MDPAQLRVRETIAQLPRGASLSRLNLSDPRVRFIRETDPFFFMRAGEDHMADGYLQKRRRRPSLNPKGVQGRR